MRPALHKAVPADIDALLALERLFPGDRISRRSFAHFLTRANADVWVYESGGRVVANAVVLYRARSLNARLYSIIVDPSARGQGVANQLVEAVETGARQRGCARVALEVRPDNAAAIRLYEKRGYYVSRTLAQFYEDGMDALRLEKSLPPTHTKPTHVRQPSFAAA
jgi:ribosomal protein S18 acetylase RimI-like enzyme